MNTKIQKLTLILATIGLVACNSGGGGNGGDTPPNPDPSPTPENIQPLQITQNVVPSLNKVAGHKIWYMVVKNVNTIPVYMYRLSSNQQSFEYDAANTSPVNPTKYAMAYDGGVNGITQDCLNYITNEFNFPAGASCAFKFEAQWDINTSATTNYNFNMAYSFITGINPNDPYDTSNNKYYTLKQGCIEQYKNHYCLANNQNLQVNVMQVSQTANDLANRGLVFNSFNYSFPLYGNIISYDGGLLWNPLDTTAFTNLYSVTYNSNNNTYVKSLLNTYNQFLYYSNSATSINGNNYYGSYYNQNGIMNNVQTTDANLKWVTGLDGNVYGSNGTTGNIYLLNQTNNTISSIVNATGETLAGVSANGNFLTMDSNNTLYCRLSNNGYTRSSFNMKGLTNVNFPILTNNYYSTYNSQSSKYYSLDGVNVNNSTSYKIDIDNCQVITTSYLTQNTLLNTKYGITKQDSNNNFYIASVNSYTDGTDGN